MMDILNMAMGAFGDDALSAMSQQAGTNKQQTQAALASALPLLINAVNKQGAAQHNPSALVQMLDQDKDGSILDDVAGFMNAGGRANGDDILGNLLGQRRGQVEKYISNDSGLNMEAVSKILSMAAPVILSYLGRQNKQTGGGIGDLLGSFTGSMQQQAPQQMNVLNQLLDRDNDGDVSDDVAELGMSFLNNLMKRR
jgi:hypothetical protein